MSIWTGIVGGVIGGVLGGLIVRLLTTGHQGAAVIVAAVALVVYGALCAWVWGTR